MGDKAAAPNRAVPRMIVMGACEQRPMNWAESRIDAQRAWLAARELHTRAGQAKDGIHHMGNRFRSGPILPPAEELRPGD